MKKKPKFKFPSTDTESFDRTTRISKKVATKITSNTTKTAAVVSDMFGLPQRGSVVTDIKFRGDGVSLGFDDGTSSFSHTFNDWTSIQDEDHEENARKWLESLFNTVQESYGVGGLFSREELEILASAIISDPDVAKAKSLRELLYRALVPDRPCHNPVQAPHNLLNHLYLAANPDTTYDVKLARRVASEYLKK